MRAHIYIYTYIESRRVVFPIAFVRLNLHCLPFFIVRPLRRIHIHEYARPRVQANDDGRRLTENETVVICNGVPVLRECAPRFSDNQIRGAKRRYIASATGGGGGGGRTRTVFVARI